MPILPKERDPRQITIRRGGTLTDEDHRLLAGWALVCAEHVLPLFEALQPGTAGPAASAAVPADEAARALTEERQWQRRQLPAAIRDLVLDDQRRRSAICRNVFDD